MFNIQNYTSIYFVFMNIGLDPFSAEIEKHVKSNNNIIQPSTKNNKIVVKSDVKMDVYKS